MNETTGLPSWGSDCQSPSLYDDAADPAPIRPISYRSWGKGYCVLFALWHDIRNWDIRKIEARLRIATRFAAW